MPSAFANTQLLARHVSLTLGRQPVLQDINLELNSGQILGVLGPNGAGKTSLLKVLSGQLSDQGEVVWRGTRLQNYSPQQRAQQIAVVNQINDSVFALTLLQIVRMGLLPHKQLLSRQTAADDQRILEALAIVGLEKKAEWPFSQLSGGEQQRGLIARALVQQAPLFILDEPVNHLDMYYQHQILQLLRVLAQQRNMTIVMSLHDLNLAANYCDQLCLLHDGQLAAQGSIQQVLTQQHIETVFRLPCTIAEADTQSGIRVDLQPPKASAWSLMEKHDGH